MSLVRYHVCDKPDCDTVGLYKTEIKVCAVCSVDLCVEHRTAVGTKYKCNWVHGIEEVDAAHDAFIE